METTGTPKEQNSPTREQDERKALDEMKAIRDMQRHFDIDRKQQFELVHEGSLLSGHDVWSLNELGYDHYQQMVDEQLLEDDREEWKDVLENEKPDRENTGPDLER